MYKYFDVYVAVILSYVLKCNDGPSLTAYMTTAPNVKWRSESEKANELNTQAAYVAHLHTHIHTYTNTINRLKTLWISYLLGIPKSKKTKTLALLHFKRNITSFWCVYFVRIFLLFHFTIAFVVFVLLFIIFFLLEQIYSLNFLIKRNKKNSHTNDRKKVTN